MTPFQKELQELINRHSQENASNTPDFILANYLVKCLDAFADVTLQRDHWYGRNHTLSNETTAPVEEEKHE